MISKLLILYELELTAGSFVSIEQQISTFNCSVDAGDDPWGDVSCRVSSFLGHSH